LSQAEGEALLPSRGGKGKGKGKEREPDFMSKERERNKREGMGKKRQETRQEKEVFIPSTVTVGRLAYIFDVKLCTSRMLLFSGIQADGYSQSADEDDETRNERGSKKSRLQLVRAMSGRKGTLIVLVLTAEEACNIALEYGFNPVVDDERSFDIYPEYAIPLRLRLLADYTVPIIRETSNPRDHPCT
jgi:translation initiation factor IF-2